MAFLNHYTHDVFVTYAHLDNEPAVLVDGRLLGWVDALVHKLDRELKQRLGTRAVNVWIDRELDGNRPITPDIMNAIRRSATLLVIMSPSYLNSEWCTRERNAFLSLVRDRVAEGSVFIVHARKVEDQTAPAEFGDLVGFPFWTSDPDVGAERPLGMPDPNEDAFVKRIFNLSHSIKEQLIRLSRSSASPARSPTASAVPTTKKSIYLARSTEDLEEREEEVKTYLEQAGFSVLPSTHYPQVSLDEFKKAMARDLALCPLFVQLLSTSRGRSLDFAPGVRLPILQAEIARNGAIRILQWRDRGIDISSVSDQPHRGLLEGARGCGIEEFKRAVVEAAVEEPEAPAARAQQGLAVFVNADTADRLLAAQVGKAFAGIGVDCFLPLREGKPETVRLDFEKNLKECDGLVLVYGDTDPDWVRTQLRQGRKILSSRDRPIAGLAILEGPPPDKQDLALAVGGLGLLNCRKGIDLVELRKFVQQLNV